MPSAHVQRIDRALLIGVDQYRYIIPNLSGCVSDVKSLATLLTDKLHTPSGNIIMLTAGLDQSEQPAELATRANIVAAFHRIASVAKKDERIYVHYSGHGMRNDYSLMPDLEADGRDEAIAPADSGYSDPAAFYLLDKELGWLIRQLTDTGAFVTMVLDCCHSASGTRDAGSSVLVRRGRRCDEDANRGSWEGGDARPRPDATLVAPLVELRQVVATPAGASGSLLPAPKNYILLTGCRESETAKEYQQHGVFTWHMLDILNRGMEWLTYQTLADRIAAGIIELASRDSSYSEQTPQVEGEGDLLVFGGATTVTPKTMIVAPQADGTLRIRGGGGAVGMTVGTTLALYPPGAVEVRSPEARIGVAVVERVWADSAQARANDLAISAVPPGSKAVVIRPGSVRLRRPIGLPDGDEWNVVREAGACAALDGGSSPYIEFVGMREQPQFTVVDDGKGNYLIRDARDLPLPRISPPLPVGNAESARRLVNRLEHIAQYYNAWELKNGEPSSLLKDRLALQIQRAGTSGGAGRVVLAPGDRVTVQAFNRADKPLSAALLYFGPDWCVKQFWPTGGDYTELRVTLEAPVSLCQSNVSLPAGTTSALERFKLFATELPSSVNALLLPSLDQARARGATTRGAQNPLESLLAMVGRGSRTRDCTPMVSGGTGDWTTAELELQTRPASGGAAE